MKYLSTEQAAQRLQVSRIAIHGQIKRGSLPAVKVGRNYIIDERIIDRKIEQKRTKLEGILSRLPKNR